MSIRITFTRLLTQFCRLAIAGFLLVMAFALGCTNGSGPADEGPQSNTLVSLTGMTDGWNELLPGGETRCSDGSEYKFFVRPGDSKKLLIYLQGGGACWFRRNCDPAMEPTYTQRVGDFHPDRYKGIFEFNNPENPFRDYTVVMAPYCSADVHIGASDTDYPAEKEGGESLTIFHRGFANMQSVLDWTYGNVSAPDQIFVTGSSAGAIPSPYYAMKIAEGYPQAKIVQLGDGAGGYRREGNQRNPNASWGTVEVLNQEKGFEGLNDTNFNYEQLYIRAGKTQPNIRFAEYDAAEDAVQKRFLALSGQTDVQLQQALDANHADIQAALPDFRSYVAGGDSHTVLARPEFYSYTVGEVTVRDWVAALANGDAVQDVSCTDCRLAEYAGAPINDALKKMWLSWEDESVQAVQPFQIFDNLYYVGIDWVAAYVLKTSDGLILIDSLYGKYVNRLLTNMQKLGLNPADVKYVLATHGHFDHAGGAALFQERFGAQVVMTAEDWALAREPASHPLMAMQVPTQDIVAEDGDQITLGDTQVTLYKTPGHTTGVLSMMYSVKDGGQAHQAITLGGVGLNFAGVERTETYIQSYLRLQKLQDGVSVSLPNHAAMGAVFERAAALEVRQPNEPHPFVDPESYIESLAAFLQNAKNKLKQEKAGTAIDPLEELTKALD